MVPVDAAARDAAQARGLDELAVWLAGVTGPRVSAREEEVPAAPARETILSVPEVAAAVDAGRELARKAAAEGVTVLVGRAADESDPARAIALDAWLAGRAPDEEIRGPLGALRRLGDAQLCVLAGLALGAGEQGLGYAFDGAIAAAGAQVAAAVEPDLRPRLVSATLADLV